MKHLLGKERKTVKVKFLGENVDVRKLSVAEVEEFQAKLTAAKEDETRGLSLQRDIIRLGVAGAEDLTDAELNSFPMDDLMRLSEEILRQAGIRAEAGN